MPSAARPSRHWLLVLAAWQLFVWATRIDNVLGDDGLTSLDKVFRVALSLSFVGIAAVLVWAWKQMGKGQLTAAAVQWVRVGAAWTVGVWVVRGIDIAASGHEAAFVVVHLVLAAVSIALAVQSVRVVAAGVPAAVSGPPRLPARVRPAMGQPVTVIQKPTPKPDVWLFQTNRSLTGMAGERYTAGTDVVGTRPPDELARRLFERGGVHSVHVAVNVATVELEAGASPDGIAGIVEDLYTHYREGVEVEMPAGAAADG